MTEEQGYYGPLKKEDKAHMDMMILQRRISKDIRRIEERLEEISDHLFLRHFEPGNSSRQPPGKKGNSE